MNPAGIPSNIGAEIAAEISIEKPTRRKMWILFLLLAFLFHFLIFLIHVQWSPNTYTPPPVEIQQVNPKKLDAIRRQWREKGLLLDQDKTKPSEKEAPPDARYMSDRNIKVKKEQRAAETNVIPKPGHPDGAEDFIRKSRPKSAPKSSTQKYPSLGNLGVPIKLDSEPKSPSETPEDAPDRSHTSYPQGGAQYFKDKDVPVGSEDLLNTQESIFYSFYARLYEEIGPIWQSRLRQAALRNRITAGDYTTTVDIVLDENGNLQAIRRLQSSGISEFDDVVDQSWRKIQRFPNPPKGLLDRERQVHTSWSFTVRVGEGSLFNMLPPERTN